MSLRLEDLIIPSGLHLAIVVYPPAEARGLVELHLQGMHEGKVIRHQELRLSLAQIAASHDPTPAFQAAVDQMLMRMHAEARGPLLLS